jgi:hypothetical protein
MPESIVKATVIYDTSQMQEGSAETVEALKSIAEQAEVTGEAMKTKSQVMAEAAKDAASKITDADLAIAKAAQAATVAKKELAAANKDVKVGAGDAADALNIQALAMKNAREAAMALAAAQAEVAATSHLEVSGVQATSGVIRSLEGNAGLRAVENFLSKTLGLGPAMQAIFPVVGALAFGTILLDVGEKIEEVRERALGAGKAIEEAFGTMHDKALLTNDALKVQDDKLKDEIGHLSGHPGNGLQTALDEAILRADKLLVSLHADRKEIEAIFKENAVGKAGSFLSGVAGTGQQQDEIKRDFQQIQNVVADANEHYAAQLKEAKTPELQKAAGERWAAAVREAYQKPLDAYKAERERLRQEQADSEAAANAAANQGESSVAIKTVDNSAKIANLEGVIRTLRDRTASIDIDQAMTSDQEKVGSLKGSGGSGGDKAAEQHLRNIETQFAQMGTRLPEEALAFWQKYNGRFKEGSSEYLHVLDQVNKYTKEFETTVHLSHKLQEEMKKSQENQDLAAPENVTRSLAEFNKLQREAAEDVTRTGQRWDGYNRALATGAEMLQRQTEQMQEVRIRAMEAAGALSPLAAAQQLAAVHTAEHTAKLKLLREELERLKAEGADLKPGDKGYEQNQTKQATTRNQITQEQGAGQLQGAQDKNAVATAMAKPYLTAFDSINNGWLKVQSSLIMGTGHISREFAQMGANLVTTMAASFEKMLVAQALMEVRSVAAHHVAVAAKMNADAVGTTVSDQLHAKSNLKQVFGDAKAAAASAYKAMAGIPVVGPELGAVAAGATFTAVMALAAFEKGGVVAGTPSMAVPILAHGGERVLTASQTNNFERMVNNNNAGAGSSLTVNMGAAHFGGGGADFKAQVKQHRMALRDEIRSLHREGHLRLS